ncbi:hypothetical protein [Neisseria musculi]|uniref:hypothetical protein n=1 Tax=Neisseria musculi TaxID=1815583 RepID=UPI00164ADDC9
MQSGKHQPPVLKGSQKPGRLTKRLARTESYTPLNRIQSFSFQFNLIIACGLLLAAAMTACFETITAPARLKESGCADCCSGNRVLSQCLYILKPAVLPCFIAWKCFRRPQGRYGAAEP